MVLNHPRSQPSMGTLFTQRRRDGCTECRRKKVKCDMGKPVCTRCKRYPRGCKYNLSVVSQDPKKEVTQRASPESQNQSIELYSRSQAMAAWNILPSQPSLNLSPYLSSEESRFYLHLFTTETAPRLFPAAPEIFLNTMISAALRTPHLLYALLASACSHHGRLIQDSTSKSTTACLKFTNSAISGLRSALSNSAETLKTETVTAAMALCTNDVCNGNMNVWRTHLYGVLQLLSGLIGHEDISRTEDTYIHCLVKWFLTMDVLASLSGLRPGCVHKATNSPLRQTTTLHTGYVDDICGYSLELVPILSRISELVLQRHTDSVVGNQVSAELIEEIDSLEHMLHSLVDRTTSDTTSITSKGFSVELQQTHNAFVHSALLHLHCRVEMVPKNDPKVSMDIKGILDAVANIQPGSPANILILWPIFSAGCETNCPIQREFIQDRMRHMQKLGMGNFTRARHLLEKFWASNTLLPWDIYFSQLGLELVLF